MVLAAAAHRAAQPTGATDNLAIFTADSFFHARKLARARLFVNRKFAQFLQFRNTPAILDVSTPQCHLIRAA